MSTDDRGETITALDLDAIEAAALADDDWWIVPALALVAEVRRLTEESRQQQVLLGGIKVLEAELDHAAKEKDRLLQDWAQATDEAEAAEAQRDEALAKVAAVEALAESGATPDGEPLPEWVSIHNLRAALATGEGK